MRKKRESRQPILEVDDIFVLVLGGLILALDAAVSTIFFNGTPRTQLNWFLWLAALTYARRIALRALDQHSRETSERILERLEPLLEKSSEELRAELQEVKEDVLQELRESQQELLEVLRDLRLASGEERQAPVNRKLRLPE